MLKKKKFLVIFIFVCLVLELVVLIPTFSKLKMASTTTSEWDKSIANSFHSGTGSIDDPYIISNAKELAYFAQELENNDFVDEYIKLSDDIIINSGFFKYDTNSSYIYNDEEYYLDLETANYYQEPTFETLKGSINEFMKLDGFKGHFDGDFHTIYGLYLDDDEVALFTNFSGELTNLYVDNALVHGTYEAAGVVLDADSAKLENIVFNGNVIGGNLVKDNMLTDTISDIEVTDEYQLDLNLPLTTSKDYSFVLKGECVSDIQSFSINGKTVSCSEFIEEVNPYDITITASSDILLTDLEYVFTYSGSLASGIVSRASNTEMTGLINKGNISNINASGLIGINYNSDIANSYNLGTVIGDNTSGIIDTIILSEVELKNIYNASTTYKTGAGLVNNIVKSDVSISNSFNNTKTTALNNVITSTVNTTNSYDSVASEKFKKFDILAIEILYPEYIDAETVSEGNIWVYDELPILYFDANSNDYVNIKIGDNTWDRYHNDIIDVNFDDNISILLTAKADYKPIKNVYYYINNIALSKEDLSYLEWKEYTDVITINEKGSYILYVKVVDYDDNVYYLNTDRLNLALDDYYTCLQTNNSSWETFHEPNNLYVSTNIGYDIVAIDKEDGIANIKYLVSDQVLTVANLEDTTNIWQTYTGKFTITNNNNYIVYVKITSNSGKVTYLNSDRIIYKTYLISNVKSGNNITFNNNMTYNSSFNFNVSLDHNLLSSGNYKRYIKTSTKLPIGTLIVLKDLESGKVYQYNTIDTSYSEEMSGYLYSLALFKEIGKVTFDTYFDNKDYNDVSTETFNVNVSFNATEATNQKIDFSFIALNDKVAINTANPVSINLFDTNTAIDEYLNISSTYDGGAFIYNKYDSRRVPLNLSLTALVEDGLNILNTNYENMHLGIAIAVVDSEGSLIDKSYYQGINFKYNGNTYTPGSNNITLIDLGNNYNQNILLDIIGSIDNSSYITDTYYFKITSYLSVDGKARKYESSDSISIPLEFNKDYTKENYSLNVVSPAGVIINKENNRIVNFNIIESGELTNPNIRVSLYKKKRLTAYDQEYELVDLKNYVEDKLVSSSTNTYYAITNPISYDIDKAVNNFSVILKDNIESNGYMFNFALYDGDNLVGEFNLKMIVR